jgi:ribosomal protein S18 acetylase RimI-like enzyme
MTLRLHRARGRRDLNRIRDLFGEYACAVDDPRCFAGFEAEIAGLPGAYAPPGGELWLAIDAGDPAGCVALRRVDAATGEIKRLYVRPAFRSHGLGRRLTRTAIRAAQATGYRRLVLDTLPSMRNAIVLYRALGFTPTAAYLDAPTAGALCLVRTL